jgi:hypothetical protein
LLGILHHLNSALPIKKKKKKKKEKKKGKKNHGDIGPGEGLSVAFEAGREVGGIVALILQCNVVVRVGGVLGTR